MNGYIVGDTLGASVMASYALIPSHMHLNKKKWVMFALTWTVLIYFVNRKLPVIRKKICKSKKKKKKKKHCS